MTNDQIETLIIKISNELAALNANLTNIVSIVNRHETQLADLKGKSETSESTFKNNIIQLLVKGTIISLMSFGTLCGAGKLIAGFMGL